MSLEDHEARIAKFEQFMAVQSVVTTGQQQLFGMILKAIGELKNDVLLLARVFVAIPLIPDDKTKQALRTEVARMEQQMEQYEHLLALAKSKLKIDPPASPPAPGS